MSTAPAPDAAAPPGMCPGVAVLGGGAGAGGGDGDGSGGSGDGSGNGDGKGDGAGGDGKGGDGCGGGGQGGSCPVHDATGTAGHPVDVVTGRAFTDPVADLILPGPIPFAWARSYSTAVCGRDLGLGHGWSHAFSFRIEARRHELRIGTDDGRVIHFPHPAVGESVLGPEDWVVRRESWGYLLDTGDDTWLTFSETTGDGKYHLLTAIQDANRNRISLRYEQDRLVELTDSVGRVVRLRSDRERRIASVEVQNAASQGQWIAFATYSYDDEGDLVAVRDAEGAVTTFTYEDHRITSECRPNGLTYHFVYDREHRCIETWGDYPGRVDPCLAAGVPALLADGITRARGIFHVKLEFGPNGYSEVADSVRVQRFFGNPSGAVEKVVCGGRVTSRVFDDRGHLVAHTDPEEHTATWKRDPRGRVLELTNAMGRVLTLDRDALGHVTQVTDPAGGVTRITRDRFGNVETITNPLGATFGYRRDARGLVVEEIAPNGASAHCRYDAHANLVEWTMRNGGVWHWTYDYLGRVRSRTDPNGSTTRYVYSTRGQMLSVHHASGGVRRYDHDGSGNVTRYVDEDGRAWTYEYGGNDVTTAITHPNGDVVRLGYNRECVVVEAHNERGEVYSLEYGSSWDVLKETTFDGRVSSFRYDKMGRLTWTRDATGRVTEYVYNPLGETIAARYADGTAESFERDRLGHIVKATSANSEVVFERDALGRVVRQAQTIAGETHLIETAYDVMGDRVERRTSRGHLERITRDALGNSARIDLDGGATVAYERDLLGAEIGRALPGGGRIESVYDPMGWLTRRRVIKPDSHVSVGAGAPEWVGASPGGLTVDKAFSYSPAGEITRRWDGHRGLTEYEYDPRGRLLSALPERARGELFAYDPASNLHEQGALADQRVYGPGNRLLSKGKTRFRWDAEGRLIEKRTPRDDGQGDRVWAYGWNQQGTLASVRRDDGVLIELVYDALCRRIEKRVSTPGATSNRTEPRWTTRFVWDQNTLVHEIRARADVADDPIVSERTYCFKDRSLVPLAHRDTRHEGEGPAESPWFHYVNDVIGTPEELVFPDGEVACRLERTAFGQTTFSPGGATTTPLRFEGQYEDEETGLVYSRARYYDPELGRFINPDPSGLSGGMNELAYAINPIAWVDPFGLDPHNATVSYDGGPPAPMNSLWPEPWKKKALGPDGKPSTGKNPSDYADGVGWSQKQKECHTEQKACANAPPGTKNIAIHGERPPCKPCRGRMQKYMDDNPGSSVTYTWDPGKDPTKAGSKDPYFNKDGSWNGGKWP